MTVLLAAGGGWWVVSGDSADAMAPVAAQERLASFSDPANGFAIDHPVGWRAEPIDGGVLLHVGGQDAVSVKRTVLEKPVDATNLEDMRAVTDAVLGAPEAGLTVLAATPTTLGGLPGVHYLYTFDAAGKRGAHTHWFAFSGTTMYTLVFQALPDTGFASLAPVFDRVAASFRTLET
jgi:hypothetical protein